MPDWKALVRKHMGNFGLTHDVEEEVVSELACHLEDCYEELRAQGLSKSEAADHALERVADWHQLAQQIQRAKHKEEIVNHRTKALWLPGLISLALSAGWMFLLQRTLGHGQAPWKHAGLPLELYLLWLTSLPLFGAMSAYSSKRLGGERLSRIAASLFLPIVMFLFWIAVTIHVATMVDGRPVQWANLFLTVLNWVVLPALALLLGALPFLGMRSAVVGKEVMNHRTKALWLPALISLAAAMVFLMISTQIALEPRIIAGRVITLQTGTTSTSYSFAVYLPWLILLPFCGAAGAYLSRRAGGQRPARLVAGLFPGIALFGLVSFLTLIGQIVPFHHQWFAFVTALLFLMVPPGIALFLGVMPFLKEPRSRAVLTVRDNKDSRSSHRPSLPGAQSKAASLGYFFSFRNLSAAASSVSSRLQKANRTC